jgi:hypothetical protein
MGKRCAEFSEGENKELKIKEYLPRIYSKCHSELLLSKFPIYSILKSELNISKLVN